ncbi:NECAP-1, N-terminal [Phytophthora cactorum]|nr:NECAP-1, N-terminal [Phytophthora cactorum]
MMLRRLSRADSWPSTPAWTGRLQVSSVGEDAVIELKDPNTGALFAACPIKAGGPSAIQKELKREKTQQESTTTAPPVDYSLKEGQTIRIKLNTKKKDSAKAEEDDDMDPFESTSSPKKTSSTPRAGLAGTLLLRKELLHDFVLYLDAGSLVALCNAMNKVSSTSAVLLDTPWWRELLQSHCHMGLEGVNVHRSVTQVNGCCELTDYLSLRSQLECFERCVRVVKDDLGPSLQLATSKLIVWCSQRHLRTETQEGALLVASTSVQAPISIELW